MGSTLRCYHAAGVGGDQQLLDELKAAVLEAHKAVRAESAKRKDHAEKLQKGVLYELKKFYYEVAQAAHAGMSLNHCEPTRKQQ